MRRHRTSSSDAVSMKTPTERRHVRVRLNKYTLQFTDTALETGFQRKAIDRYYLLVPHVMHGAVMHCKRSAHEFTGNDGFGKEVCWCPYYISWHSMLLTEQMVAPSKS